MVNSSGAMAAQYVYTPYGVEEPYNASTNPYRYTGRRLEAEWGIFNYRARYYDPALGRFYQTDPVLYADQFNLYAYVGNDPLNMTDPDGKERISVGEQRPHDSLISAQRAAAEFIGETLAEYDVQDTGGDFEVSVSIKESDAGQFRLQHANISNRADGSNADHALNSDGSTRSTVHNHNEQQDGARDRHGATLDGLNMRPTRPDRNVATTGQRLMDENEKDGRFQLGIVTPDGALTVWEAGESRANQGSEIDPPGTYDYVDN